MTDRPPTRVMGYHPAIQLSLHLLGVAMNPACWFVFDDVPELERRAGITMLEDELDGLLEDAWLAVFEEYVNDGIPDS